MAQSLDIKKQIEEEYGKVVYSYASHQYCANDLLKTDKLLKIIEIVISAIITAGLISLIAKYYLVSTIISVAFSCTLIIISSLIKAGDYQLKAYKHSQTALDLWKIREKYLSLLTDFEKISENEVRNRRDLLLEETKLVYSNEERTNDKAYKRAQKAIKEEGYQFFSRDELNNILPEYLRHE